MLIISKTDRLENVPSGLSHKLAASGLRGEALFGSIRDGQVVSYE